MMQSYYILINKGHWLVFNAKYDLKWEMIKGLAVVVIFSSIIKKSNLSVIVKTVTKMVTGCLGTITCCHICIRWQKVVLVSYEKYWTLPVLDPIFFIFDYFINLISVRRNVRRLLGDVHSIWLRHSLLVSLSSCRNVCSSK